MLATLGRSLYNLKLQPSWVTGFINGEGCFIVSVTENHKLKVRIEVRHFFFK